MQMIECTGLEIPLELFRMSQLSDRPYTLVHTTDPKYKAGMIYEGVRLESVVTSFDKDSKVANLISTFNQRELGYRRFVWTPEGVEKNPLDLEILKLTIFSYGKEKRVALREGKFEKFVSQLPTPLSQEYLKVIEYQRWLESTLPKLPNNPPRRIRI